MIDGILWILRTGSPWRDLPEEFGPWQTVWHHFDKWNGNGLLDEILNRLRACHVDAGAIDDELWCVDGTVVRAARCAAGGGKKGIPTNRKITRWAAREAVFSTKIHLLCDRHGHPLHFHLTPGQTHESQALIDLLEGAEVVDHDDMPMAHPVRLAGDKGYRAQWIDDYLLRLGITPVIPSKTNQDRDARHVEIDHNVYRQRNIIERLIGWLKESRRIFSRFEKTAKNFAGMLKMAPIHRYLRIMCD